MSTRARHEEGADVQGRGSFQGGVALKTSVETYRIGAGVGRLWAPSELHGLGEQLPTVSNTDQRAAK